MGKACGTDVPEVAQTLAEAFFTDPMFAWWMPSEARRKEILPAFFALAVSAFLTADEVYRDSDGVAAAVWTPPGGRPSEEDMAALAPAMAAVAGEYAGTLFESMEVMDAADP